VSGFPPAAAQPGAVGDPGYSPLVQVLFRGKPVVLNAPQIANESGQADKVVAIAGNHRTVSYRETDGCYDNEAVHYASFDASDPGAAAIEDVTYAPALAAAPAPGCADAAVVAANCSRESLIAFTNGQTGATNPQRQGLNAAILDGPPPLNLLQEIPEQKSQFDYSPLWDVHPGEDTRLPFRHARGAAAVHRVSRSVVAPAFSGAHRRSGPPKTVLLRPVRIPVRERVPSTSLDCPGSDWRAALHSRRAARRSPSVILQVDTAADPAGPAPRPATDPTTARRNSSSKRSRTRGL
jgi:hypothetical protein